MFTRNSETADNKSDKDNSVQNETASPAEKSGRSSNARETVISNDLTIHGNVTSEGIVRLEGTIIGDMNCSSLVVEGPGAISGNIAAEQVNVHGRVEGTVHGKNVMLHSSAFVEGDIYHQGIGIEMGTQYDGRLKWVKSEEEGKRLVGEKSSPVVNDNAPHAQAAE